MEGGVQAVPLLGALAPLGDEPLPGQGPGPLEQGLEVPGGEGAQHDQHPLAGAQVQIQPGQVGPGAAAPPGPR